MSTVEAKAQVETRVGSPESTVSTTVASGDYAWSSPVKVVSSNNQFSQASDLRNNNHTARLEVTKLGLGLPTYASIQGIEVEVEGRSDKNSNVFQDASVELIVGGVPQGENKAQASWSQSEQTVVYGGANDLWGLSLSETDVNAGNFGVAIRWKRVGKGRIDAQIDHVLVRVHFIDVGPPADLEIAMVESADPVTETHDLTYSATVTNHGPEAANAVTLSAPLPAGLAMNGAPSVSNGGSCDPAMACDLGSLAVGASASVTIPVTAMSVGTIVYPTTVSAQEHDPSGANNASSASTTVMPLTADLSVSFTGSADPVTETHDVTYTATITNAGPDPATAVSLAAALPANATLVSTPTPSNAGSCDAAVNCSLGSLAVGELVTVPITVTANAAGSISYSVSVGAAEVEPNSADNSANVATTVAPLTADLSVSLTGSADPVTETHDVTYTATITNAGPDPATAVSLAAALPANATLVSTPSPSNGGSCDAAVNCSLGSLAVGESVTVPITVSANAAGSINYSVSVSAAEVEPNSADNADSVTTTVIPLSADLRLSLTESEDPVTEGNSVTYNLAVTNDGPDAATAVSLNVTLPGAGQLLVTPQPDNDGTCDTVVTCDLGAIASGETVIVPVQWVATSEGSISLSASVSATEGDPDGTNNAVSESTTVVAPMGLDLALSVTESQDPVTAGGSFSYSALVTNQGTDLATGVTLDASLASGLVFVSAGVAGGSCDNTVTCSLPNLAAGASATVTVTVTATTVGSRRSNFEVSANEPDLITGNNLASVTTTVDPSSPPPTGSTFAGATELSISVDESGAANISIPIAVPPGVAGMAPTLSLNYSSRSGNGPLGLGWSLGGLSAIHRCPRTIAQDGVTGGVNYDGNDRYCLDGQRLVAVNGAYGANGTEYRTEVDGFTKVESVDVAGDGPKYWRVWTKSGQFMRYGGTGNSRIEKSGSADVRVWTVDRIKDFENNLIDFVYSEANGNYYLTSVAYGGNDSSAIGSANFASVNFTYQTRPDAVDLYANGSLIRANKRLSRVETQNAGALVKSFDVNYDTSFKTGRSRVASMRECDGSGTCRDDIAFDWSDSREALGPSSIWHESGLYSDYRWQQALLDMNGDGMADYVRHVASSAGTRVIVFPSNGSGFGNYRYWNSSTTGYNANWRISFPDMNGDGLPDLVRHYMSSSDSSGTRVHVGLNNGSGFDPTTVWDNTPSGYGSYWTNDFIDMNGDGLPDHVRHCMRSSSYGTRVVVALNTGSGFGPASYWDNTPTGYGSHWTNSFIDMNGDGLADHVRHYIGPNSGDGTRVVVALNTGSGFGTAEYWDNTPGYNEYWANEFIDLNGDGLPDHVRHFISPSSWSSGTRVQVALNTGAGFGSPSYWQSTTSGFNRTWQNSFIDMNGDGLVDHVRHYVTSVTRVLIGLNTGSGFASAKYWDSSSGYSSQWTNRFADVNGDGLTDYARLHPTTDDGYGLEVQVRLNDGVVPDQLLSVTDSLGATTAFDYAPLTDNGVYTKGDGAVFPEVDVIGPMYVASSVSMDNGIGGTKHTDYHYHHAKQNIQGRGFLGFDIIGSTDSETGNVTTTYYNQAYPYISQVRATYSWRPGGSGTYYKSAFNTWDHKVLNGGATVFPYVKTSLVNTFEPNHGPGNSPYKTVTTTTEYDDFGNATRVTQTSQGAGETFTTVTDNLYSNDTAKWILGRLTEASVTHSLPDGSSGTRASSFTYDAVTGLLKSETIEPGTADELTTTYSHDGFGNVTTTTVTGADIATRSSGMVYDTAGRFPVSESNALGHSETHVYDPRFGIMTSLTGPNGLTTTWEVDGFGRKTREVRADGTESRWDFLTCDASFACPSGAVFAVRARSLLTATGAEIAAASIEYRDILGRVIRSESEGFDGTPVFVDTQYNARGLITQVSEPTFIGTPAAEILWTVNAYDLTGRVTSITGPNGGVATTIYDGFEVHALDPLGHDDCQIKNAIGQLVEVIDHELSVVTYDYDPFGNLIQTTDPAFNQITMDYDIRGNKIAMTDPDMGAWSYDYNVLGELVSQTDAKGQTSSLTYDLLGRLIQRVEPEGTSTWTYDTGAGAGIGKIAQEEGPNGNFLRSFSYDTLGRSDNTTTTIDGRVYTTSQSYDAEGRLERLTYPSGFAVDHLYNAGGFLEQVVGADATARVYWEGLAANAEGQITAERLADGLVSYKSYDPETDLPSRIETFRGLSAVQDLTFTFDLVGNLMKRADMLRDREEVFAYDNLNRLTATSLTVKSSGQALSATAIAYDALGNITNKTGVGAYSYGSGNTGPGAAGPHAVIAAGGKTYQYDANGNMTSGTGRSVLWSSFNKPIDITNTVTGEGTAFTYGPDRSRYKQVIIKLSGLTAVDYVGSLYEFHAIDNALDERRHYIRGPGGTLAIYTQEGDGPTPASEKTRVLLKDHLGSVTDITDENGVVTESLSYDPWGQRRAASDWSEASGPLESLETRRGFTGHEMLEEVGLIHMNGRVYDPVLGRFLSADPFVQAPESTQSLNRYTYVNNNPLSYSDPSGFFFKKLFKGIAKLVGSVLRAIAKIPGLNAIIQASLAFACGPFGPVCAGAYAAATTLASGGDFGQALLSAAVTIGSGYLNLGIGDYFGEAGLQFLSEAHIVKTIATGVVSGAASVAQGGKFHSGFLAGAASAFAYPAIRNLPLPGKLLAGAAVGGTASVIGGGKFANGAVAGAYSYALAHWAENRGLEDQGQQDQEQLANHKKKSGTGSSGKFYTNYDHPKTLDFGGPAIVCVDGFQLSCTGGVSHGLLVGRGGPSKPGTQILNVTPRQTRDGSTGIRVERADGSILDVTGSRVKEFVPNLHPSAPPGTMQRIRFEDAIPGSKGYKRLPSQEELDLLEKYK